MRQLSYIEQLNSMGYLYKRMMSPNIPAHAAIRPKWHDGTANNLTGAIRDYLKMKGHYCGRTNTTGTYSVKLGRFIHSGATPGQSDLNAIVHGRSWQIEVKVGKDKLSAAQEKVKEQVLKAGGIYLVARTFRDFIEQYKTITGETEAELFHITDTKQKQLK